nr:mitotic checkpoint protein BUB3.2 [Ipomoea batatas]
MTTVTLLAGRELWNPPTDGISNLRFSNHNDHLLVFSWDKTVRLYNASANVLRGEFMHGGPCSIVASTMILRALVQVITGSWDKTLKCWDPRGASRQEHTLVGTYVQLERVYSLSLVGNRLLVTTTGSLIEMKFFDLFDAGQSKKYAFKCHPNSEAGRDIVYPVNAIAFHPIYGTFATGGCDGFVNVWDRNNKKRLYQYSKYPVSIAALSFNKDGRLLAVASSYTFEDGQKPHEPDTIFLRSVNEVEVKPKPKRSPPLLEQRSLPMESYCSVAYSHRRKKPKLRWNKREVKEGAR